MSETESEPCMWLILRTGNKWVVQEQFMFTIFCKSEEVQRLIAGMQRRSDRHRGINTDVVFKARQIEHWKSYEDLQEALKAREEQLRDRVLSDMAFDSIIRTYP